MQRVVVGGEEEGGEEGGGTANELNETEECDELFERGLHSELAGPTVLDAPRNKVSK